MLNLENFGGQLMLRPHF